MGKRVVLGGLDPFLHSLVIGPTGSGKTSRVLKPMVWQILEAYAKGNKVGLTIIEPKGDFAYDTYKAALEYGVPAKYIDPNQMEGFGLNPLKGEPEVVAEMIRTVLRRMFGKQDAFFAQVQETAARNTVMLIKKIYGDEANLLSVVRALRDQKTLESEVKIYEKKHGTDDLTDYFHAEVLGNDKFQQFATGLRQQLEDIIGNSMVRRVLLAEKTIDWEDHLENGGVIVINTEMGRLGKLGDVFGQFCLMTLQNAVFRRPGDEWTRRLHYLFVDEFPRYANPDVERILAIGRSFRCACTFAIQNLGQLKVDGFDNFSDVVMTNCRNKLLFGGANFEDAKRFANEFGKEKRAQQKETYGTNFLGLKSWMPDRIAESEMYQQRFTETQIKEMPAWHFVYQLVEKGQPMTPGMAKGSLAITKPKEEPLDMKGNLGESIARAINFISRLFPPKKADLDSQQTVAANLEEYPIPKELLETAEYEVKPIQFVYDEEQRKEFLVEPDAVHAQPDIALKPTDGDLPFNPSIQVGSDVQKQENEVSSESTISTKVATIPSDKRFIAPATNWMTISKTKSKQSNPSKK